MTKLTTPDGNVCEGEVRGAELQGQGRMTAPHGGGRRRALAEGEVNGRGRMVPPDGRIEGSVSDDGRLVCVQAPPPSSETGGERPERRAP